MENKYMHFIITRFNIPAKYEGGRNQSVLSIDPRTNRKYLDERFRLFEKYTFPSIRKQSNQQFTWLVLFSNQTPKEYVSRVVKLKGKWENFRPLYLTDKEAYNFNEYLNDVLSEYDSDYYITTRIDNDDAISVKFIERIQNYCFRKEIEKAVLSFSYGLQLTEKNKTVAHQTILGNHFITLVAPREPENKTIISFPHGMIPKEIPRIDIGNRREAMWIEVVHGSNFANRTFFNIKNAAVSTKIFEEFVCEIEWRRKDVMNNLFLSIWGTCRCFVQLIKKRRE